MNEMRIALSAMKKNDDLFFLIPPKSRVLVPVSAEDHSLFLLEALRRYSLYRKKDFEVFPLRFLFSPSSPSLEGFESASHFEIESERISRGLGGKNPSSAVNKLIRLAYANEALARGCSLIALPTCFEEYLSSFRENLLKKGKLGAYSFYSPASGGASFIRPFLSLEEETIRKGEQELLLPCVSLPQLSPLDKEEARSFKNALFYGESLKLPKDQKRITLQEEGSLYFVAEGNRIEVKDACNVTRAAFLFAWEDAHRLSLSHFVQKEGVDEGRILRSYLETEIENRKPPLWVKITLEGFHEHPELGFSNRGNSIYRKIWRREDLSVKLSE